MGLPLPDKVAAEVVELGHDVEEERVRVVVQRLVVQEQLGLRTRRGGGLEQSAFSCRLLCTAAVAAAAAIVGQEGAFRPINREVCVDCSPHNRGDLRESLAISGSFV